MVRGALLAALTLAAVSQAAATAQDWSQWRGPARDGVAPFSVPSSWPATLTRRWALPVGVGHASPVIAGGRVVVHTREGEREITRAVDLASGRELWRHDEAVPYTMNPAARGHGPGPKSTPVIAGSRVFTFGISGVLTALDLASGKVLWRADAPPSPPEFGTAMSPIVEGALVIVHLGANDTGAMTAFDVATGRVRWRWRGDGPAYASPVIAVIGGLRQLVTQSENAVVGIDVADGRLLWRIPFTTDFDQNSVTPLVVNDLVIYSGLNNGTSAARPLRQASGWTIQPVWHNPQVSMYMSSPVIAGATIFGLSHRSRGQFVALDAASGRTLWTTPGREGDNASIVRAGEVLLLITTNAELIVAGATRERLAPLARYTIAPSAVWAHPAVSGRQIVVKDVDTLICWTL